ncbi:MAG: efflux RND transporter periplasmic adaptor subunit [Deltaproteobacteria bacterium]|nr:efflux RND transporter periplasmic adaptor subunit [Deltaproteobacteria bacterium]
MHWHPSKKSRRALALGLAVLATLAVGGCRDSKPAVQWETAAVDRGRVVARVTATGTLSALVTVQVGSQVSGRVQRLLVDYNSPVKKGQLIAKIDPQLFQASLEQARANYAAAEGNLAKAKVQAAQAEIDFGRQASLAERKLVAPADFDLAKTNLAAAKAQVAVATGNLQQAKAALGQAKVNLAYTSIYSPTDGVVISRNVDVGQTVAASLSAPTIFVIAEDLRKMQVNTSVAEADVGKLSAGMDATFVVDAFPGERFRGKVRQIRNAAQTVQNVVTYDAVIDVENPELKLRPGMTANVNFVFADREDVLRIPNAALRFRPGPELWEALKMEPKHARGRKSAHAGAGQSPGKGGPPAKGGKDDRDDTPDRRTVWLLRAGAPQPVRIKVGATDGSKTEVVEGPLVEGDQVISDATVTGGGKRPTGFLPGAPPPSRGGRGPRF